MALLLEMPNMGGFYRRSAVLNTVVKKSALLSYLKLVAHPISALVTGSILVYRVFKPLLSK